MEGCGLQRQEGSASQRRCLLVSHETRYEYESPVTQSHHRACLQPLSDAAQHLESFELEIDPNPSHRTGSVDASGHFRHAFELHTPHQVLSVRARSRVQVADRFAGLEPDRGAPWESVRARLAYVARQPFEPAVEYAQPSPYVPRLGDLRDWAAESLEPRRPLAAASLDLMHRLHRHWAYRPHSTAVETPLATAFEQRAGVCQDFAHLLIGALRMHGLAARYVSGYLLTVSAPGQPLRLGADASHAWVQVWCPQTPGVPADGWLDLDPTNDRVADTDHVRVAVGRDFGDVTPLRGVVLGGGRHLLNVAVTTIEAPEAGDDTVRPDSCVSPASKAD